MGKRAAQLVGDATPVRPSVEPLRCPTCGAPVPLGDADVVPCVACGAQVPVPAPLRELRRAEREDRADRAEAEALYEQLGKPPSVLLRAWVRVFVVGAAAAVGAMSVLVAIGGIALIFLVVGLELALHGLAGPLGIDLIDRFGGGWTYAGFAAAALVFGILPMWLTQYLQDSGELRVKLQANLAAKPPKQPGFPSRCRECGAALEVPPGAYGVRCTYCRSDNLVQLPATWLARIGHKHEHFHGSIVDAVAKAKALRSDARATLTLIAIGGAIGVAVIGGAGHVATALDEGDRQDFHWSASIGPPRALIDMNAGPVAANAGGSIGDAWIALRHREAIEIAVDDVTCPVIEIYGTTTFELLGFSAVPAFGRAPDGSRVARFRAPYTGIFIFHVKAGTIARWHFVHGAPPPLAPLTGCAETP